MVDSDVEPRRNEFAVRFRLEEEAVPTGSRELDDEPNDTAFGVGLLGMNVEIGEVAISQCNEVTQRTEIRVEMGDTTITTDFEFEGCVCPMRHVLWRHRDSIAFDGLRSRRLRMGFVVGGPRGEYVDAEGRRLSIDDDVDERSIRSRFGEGKRRRPGTVCTECGMEVLEVSEVPADEDQVR
ncbi:hypothetical protein [Halomarina ordinaria]|uniref:hypothetical protein n=1 Tax=Halomarina ordinaria TaxID=3033939 RepID=UPI0026F4262B|nr:hypothetical protein [Halomarina sp. PSRA2]